MSGTSLWASCGAVRGRDLIREEVERTVDFDAVPALGAKSTFVDRKPIIRKDQNGCKK